VPNQYRHLARLDVRYAAWDLTQVHLVDERLGQVMCRLFPQDKARNADGLRRSLDTVSNQPVAAAPPGGMAPLLARLLERQTASGLPPAYLVKDEGTEE
jgi:putative transposase